jgi:cation diffusion facilitator family transporter
MTRRRGQRVGEAGKADESFSTVLLAGAANLAIAAAKILAGLASGSSAMLAEGAHSVADTLNQVFLLTALTRSRKPPDSSHQFGYGKERYFWSLLAAVGIFVLGAGFSILEGIDGLRSPEPVTHLALTYGVLVIALLFDGASWLKALVQLKREARARQSGILEHVRSTTDPTAKTVAFEDTAALIGVGIAAAGVTLHAWTGRAVWDGAASILIGLLLVAVAYSLGRQNMALLIGEAVPEREREAMISLVNATSGVDVVVELLTMRLGPDEVLVAARVDLDDAASGDDAERIADDVEAAVRERFPHVRHVFIDPTTAPGR